MEEPNALIRWTIFLFAGGDAGILGAFSIAAIAMLSSAPNRRRPIRPFHVAVVVTIGSVLILCGSLPIPIWLKIATAMWAIFAGYQLRFRTVPGVETSMVPVRIHRTVSGRLLFLCPFVWLTALVSVELPFHLWFERLEPISQLLIIGDSVTAGLNDNDDTWPRQLARVANVEVLDASQPGATLRSARQQNDLLAGQTALMILEIGGNDMLEGLPVARFERDLDQLLTETIQPQRTVVMFELPLPPLCAEYGLAQRRQALNHRVKLIPKRRFAKVLTSRGATVDGIHLSNNGQSKMMALIRSLFGDQLRSGRGTYRQFERT